MWERPSRLPLTDWGLMNINQNKRLPQHGVYQNRAMEVQVKTLEGRSTSTAGLASVPSQDYH